MPPSFAGPCLVHAVEALEDAHQILLRNADAAVLHLKRNLPCVCRPANLDASTRGRVFQGIIDEIVQDDAHGLGIGPSRGVLFAEALRLQNQVLGRGPCLVPFHTRSDRLLQRHRFEMQHFFAGLDPCQAK